MSAESSKDRASLCAFCFSDGRQCRALRHKPNSRYCLPHVRKTRHLEEADEVAKEILSPVSSNFVSASALTQSLVQLYSAIAEGRIPPKHTSALAKVSTVLMKYRRRQPRIPRRLHSLLLGTTRPLLSRRTPQLHPPPPRKARPRSRRQQRIRFRLLLYLAPSWRISSPVSARAPWSCGTASSSPSRAVREMILGCALGLSVLRHWGSEL
jgi:hypothetical protein